RRPPCALRGCTCRPAESSSADSDRRRIWPFGPPWLSRSTSRAQPWTSPLRQLGVEPAAGDRVALASRLQLVGHHALLDAVDDGDERHLALVEPELLPDETHGRRDAP